jgi:hypothetical protein
LSRQGFGGFIFEKRKEESAASSASLDPAHGIEDSNAHSDAINATALGAFI